MMYFCEECNWAGDPKEEDGKFVCKRCKNVVRSEKELHGDLTKLVKASHKLRKLRISKQKEVKRCRKLSLL